MDDNIRTVYADGIGWVGYGRDDDGDLFVNVNTEDASEANDADGMPQVLVYLNDATLYDPRRPVTAEQAVKKIEAEIAGGEVEQKRCVLIACAGYPSRYGVTFPDDAMTVIGWTDDEVEEAWSMELQEAAFEVFDSEDYETYDEIEGRLVGLHTALKILKGTSA